MSNVEIASAVLAGLKNRENATADQVRDGKHEANNCGQQSWCMGQGG